MDVAMCMCRYVCVSHATSDGEPVQLHYSSDDGDISDNEFANFGSVPQ